MKSVLRAIFFMILSGTVIGTVSTHAQVSQGGIPATISRAIAPDPAHFFTLDPPSIDLLAAEDEKEAVPYRFAVNLPADLDICRDGTFTRNSDGTNVWRLNIKSPGAQALLLYFDRYEVPAGGRLFVYNPARTQILGAFTNENNNKHSTFATGLINGEELTIEYNGLDGMPLPLLHVSEVGYAYRGINSKTRGATGFGGAGSCEVNINCAEGAYSQIEKRSVARISVKRGNGTLWCTGSLVNNVRNDGTPYFLTADHCGRYSSEIDLTQWIFYFNYETGGCPDPNVEPASNSMTGATLVAHGGNAAASGSDFFLVLLSSKVPNSYNPYFNGWSRVTDPPSGSGTTIHHPQGDIKKVSTYTTPLQATFWKGGSKLAHWLVYWTQTQNGYGVTEGGSSGAPLYDAQGRLIGTLTGGDSACDTAYIDLPDYYGMFSYSWDKNGTDSTEVLKYWLDPDNTGTVVLNGWALDVQENNSLDHITVFPNPAKDMLNINYPVARGKNIQLDLYDVLGNRCITDEVTVEPGRDIQVNINGLSSGMYLLAIRDGQFRAVRKIFVE